MHDPLDLVHTLTLGDVLREHARSRPAQLGAIDGDTRLDYQAVARRVNRLAHALDRDGVGPGDRVVWMGQNSFRVVELLLAAAKLGACCCPVNWRQSPEELAFVVDDLRPRVVVWQHEEIGAATAAARERVNGPTRWIAHDDDGTDGYEAWLPGGG